MIYTEQIIPEGTFLKIQLLISHLETKLVPYYNDVNVFCACFSLSGDELPMWNAYAADAGSPRPTSAAAARKSDS